jgi:hypothetical protein
MTSRGGARFDVAKHVHFRRFNDEVVLLDLAGGKYFALDEVGSTVWERLAAGGSIEDVIAEVVRVYDVDEARARSDVARLTGDLQAAGLISPAPQASAS